MCARPPSFAGHIAAARHCFLGSLSQSLATLDRTRPVIAQCQSGARLRHRRQHSPARRLLRHQSVRRVQSLDGFGIADRSKIAAPANPRQLRLLSIDSRNLPSKRISPIVRNAGLSGHRQSHRRSNPSVIGFGSRRLAPPWISHHDVPLVAAHVCACWRSSSLSVCSRW